MDSMRSLNTSLPRAQRPRPAPQPDTHQSFRTAALTVTNLYKAALADMEKSRSEGYQEAIEDLMSFLDKENLGKGDIVEGWRIRQWALDRLDGAAPGQHSSDSDEEAMEEKRARSSSPVMERTSSPEETRSSACLAAVESTHRSDSAPPPVQMESSTTEADLSLPTVFHFSSPQSFPSSNPTDVASPDWSASARRAFGNPRRPANRAASRNLQRTAAQNMQNVFSLGAGAGQKRKMMQDFFNVDFNDRRDGPGGGPKRGRMT
ncbi:hypothetical protein BS50DRAFT_550714 [Corynespora cassiicola Philippines]|uniref:Uncharacterized protein n=1 Tax=Corynespora cassiicola Philippines TaxID=1448308 RepID=A0A2T2NQL3_CORCC|nr:hypothetical protein BS50DRAFT_550714 [Corynespora cassiicola Philippines]